MKVCAKGADCTECKALFRAIWFIFGVMGVMALLVTLL